MRILEVITNCLRWKILQLLPSEITTFVRWKLYVIYHNYYRSALGAYGSCGIGLAPVSFVHSFKILSIRAVRLCIRYLRKWNHTGSSFAAKICSTTCSEGMLDMQNRNRYANETLLICLNTRPGSAFPGVRQNNCPLILLPSSLYQCPFLSLHCCFVVK